MSAAAAESASPEPLTPSLEEVRALLGEYDLVGVSESRIDDTETPVSALLKLRVGDERPAFLLESAESGRVGRYSFIGVRPRKVLRWSLGDPGDPYALAQAELDGARAAPAGADSAPFTGGAVGYFAYDLVRTVEPLGEPNPDPLGLPDLALMFTDVLVSFDHLRHTITVTANVYAEDRDDLDGAYERARATIAEVWQLLAGPVPRADVERGGDGVAGDGAGGGAMQDAGRACASGRTQAMPEFKSNMTREQFEANVARIVEYIFAGDAFQVVPSQRWSAQVPVGAFSIYRGLRAINPSPYMYFLDFGDFQIAGASPEPLITVTGRRVSTRPIAGTRPRGGSVEEDAQIAQSLLADPKERAEHVMLVDLGRNDLGRVCEYGSVEVEDFMVVENYSHVMHIVSNVAGRLRDGVRGLDALRSVLPAGTLSGAPKVRAMQIIDELEPVKRGSYGGAIGHVGYNGDLDVCIHIRTVIVKDGVAHVQAGGGTVADALPANEYEESVAKSSAVRAAVELACRQPGWA